MRSRVLKKDEWPEPLARFLRKLFYKKHTVSVTVDSEFEVMPSIWDGGSKISYQEFGVGGTFLQTPPLGRKPLTDGRVLIEGGIFCGKQATWHLNMTANTAKELGL